jgi:transposase
LEDVNRKVGIQQEDIMPKGQRTFTKECKLEAVHLAQTSRTSQAQIARDLGIADSTLHHWCKEWSKAGEKAFVGSGNPVAEEEELRRLKRELEVTRQERDIFMASIPLQVVLHAMTSLNKRWSICTPRRT